MVTLELNVQIAITFLFHYCRIKSRKAKTCQLEFRTALVYS